MTVSTIEALYVLPLQSRLLLLLLLLLLLVLLLLLLLLVLLLLVLLLPVGPGLYFLMSHT
jgi:hypothetical protein